MTLSCLPAGSPEPKILWIKGFFFIQLFSFNYENSSVPTIILSPVLIDKKHLEINDRMSLMACPDGRQLLMIMKTSKKDAGIYECVASNNLASATTSCILSIACKLKKVAYYSI